MEPSGPCRLGPNSKKHWNKLYIGRETGYKRATSNTDSVRKVSRMNGLRFHHVCISVQDLDRTAAFYSHFGFSRAFEWRATDGSLSICHFAHPTGVVLEAVRYAENTTPADRPGVGNDLSRVGVKHLALHVDDIDETYRYVTEQDLGETTSVSLGRTGFRLFFLRDPDDIWLELLSDERSLDVQNPTIIEEAPRLIPGE